MISAATIFKAIDCLALAESKKTENIVLYIKLAALPGVFHMYMQRPF